MSQIHLPNSRFIASVAIVMIATVMAGCSAGGSPVRGAVSFDDAPVESGTISFLPADGKGPTFGGVIEKGRYAVVAPTPGPKVVRVSAVRPTGRKLPPDPLVGETAPLDEIAPYIPEQYNDRSTLVCDVVAGSNTFDFHLKSP